MKPGSIPTFNSAIAKVKKIRYYKGSIKSNCKWHVTIGYTTVMANVIFFSHEVSPSASGEDSTSHKRGSDKMTMSPFEWVDYEYQDELLDSRRRKEPTTSDAPTLPPVAEREYWCLLQFERTIQCPADSIIIGTKLDADIVDNMCRIAFHGRISQVLSVDDSGMINHQCFSHTFLCCVIIH